MAVMTLSGLQKTGKIVSADMFGANAVFSHTDLGVPGDAYVSAAQALGVQNIRFGGGQADLDLTRANDAGAFPVDGATAINIVQMDGTALRPELVNFLEWCVAQTLAGNPTKATLIIPTKHLDVDAYGDFAADIEAFTSTVMQQYGDVIAAFQIGNEYWEMGETAYGIKASLAAEALARGLGAAGYAEADQPDILVQMGTAGNAGSEFPATPGVSDFIARNKAANLQIIDQLSDAARAAIDGVTEHYYYNKSDYLFGDLDSEVKNIGRDFRIWADALGPDLDLHITEWNVKTTAVAQQGMVAGSSVVKQFENMIEIGVDGAHVWALDYHSRTALTLQGDGGARLDDQGRLTNSAQGAVFDLMSDALIGKELVSASFANGLPEIAVSTYADAQEMVFYISSRSLEKQSITLDFAAKLPVSGPVTAVQVSMDAATSNGQQWERGVAADSVLIDGAPYYFNEHDVDVILTDMVFDDASQIALTLKPFEVVELTLALAPNAGQSVSRELQQSGAPTAASLSADAVAAITELYIAYFDRAPASQGLLYWVTQLENGMSLREIAESFFVQPETQRSYADFLDGQGRLTDTQGFVTAVFNNVLGRDPSGPYWVNELESNPAITPAVFILAVLNGAKAVTGGAADAAYLETKTDIGVYFAAIKGLSGYDNTVSVMEIFDGSAASVMAAVSEIDRLYTEASTSDTGDFLMSLVGVIDDPFAMG